MFIAVRLRKHGQDNRSSNVTYENGQGKFLKRGVSLEQFSNTDFNSFVRHLFVTLQKQCCKRVKMTILSCTTLALFVMFNFALSVTFRVLQIYCFYVLAQAEMPMFLLCLKMKTIRPPNGPKHDNS